ncbi:Carbon catabolite repressor protein 4 like 4 [Dendrobium catenatum]|uniref:Carbon catabolite repressor protein 4 like 4 n=2 Tax=Dendrobium catenatum TaxID=906689 RepID=A0A2I0W7M3_9ASPA|nr:Carbon catabolite repressor protein 4 like 4 [Dendrobium catenatum]
MEKKELDEFDNFYKGNMEKHGYSSIYVQRTGQKRDGCGIFFKHKSAELILGEEIHYNDLIDTIDCKNGSTDIGIERTLNEVVKEGMVAEDPSNKNDDDECGNQDDPCVRLKRDCVALLAAFKLKDPSKHVLVVANTHIYWDPAWVDVKLAQVKYLLSRLSRFKDVIANKFSCTPSVIVAGDFNSTPGDEVYEYITSTAANVDNSAHDMRFYSLYRTNGGEPLFTNCTPDFTGTLDYIFLSDTCHLKAVSLLKLPHADSTDIVGGLPNHYHPSDHLPIGGEFELLSAASSSVADHLNDVEISLVELKLQHL